ncbi:myosin K, partial [Cardiosporidium cionae]
MLVVFLSTSPLFLLFTFFIYRNLWLSSVNFGTIPLKALPSLPEMETSSRHKSPISYQPAAGDHVWVSAEVCMPKGVKLSPSPLYDRSSASKFSDSRTSSPFLRGIMRCRGHVSPTDPERPNAEVALVNIISEEAGTPPFTATLPINQIFPQDKTFGVSDNTQLLFLNPPNLLENIRTRYLQSFEHSEEKAHHIYTSTGSLLIAVNPFCEKSIYTEKWITRFFRKSFSTAEPHPFSFAEHTYRRMIAENMSQSIIISGESGAGKTETSKHVLQYLMAVSHDQTPLKRHYEELQLRQTIPLMEAFGNAKTIRNSNSSRFGKLLKLHFDESGQLSWASLQTYLLAKSRVVNAPPDERNYHIFYSLLEDATPEERKAYYLTEINDFRYIRSSEWKKEDKKFALADIRHAFRAIGVSSRIQEDIFRTLAAILHLGNIEFIANKNDETTLLDNLPLHRAAKLLGFSKDVGSSLLYKALTSRHVIDVSTPLSPLSASHARDTLAKALYSALFEYIVSLMNIALVSRDPSPLGENDGHGKASPTETRFIGILDIFGFENLNPNSDNGFEQLCINYANEELHSFFIKQFIIGESYLYKKEGIPWKSLEVKDNIAVCEIIRGLRGHAGILGLLDESSRLSVVGSKDELFCAKIHQTFKHCQRSNALKQQRGRITECFTLKHYAGEVKYTAEGFVKRNTDFLSDDLLRFLASSGHFVSTLAHFGKENNQRRCLGTLFAKHVNLLLKDLSKTSSHYIRCLKPNDFQQSHLFDSFRMNEQLIYSGMVEALEVMRDGFPCRVPYADLWERYSPFLPSFMQSHMHPKDFVDILMQYLKISSRDYRLGNTRAFFRFGLLEKIQKLRYLTDEETKQTLMDETYSFWLKKRKKRCFLTIRIGIRLSLGLKKIRAKKLAEECFLYYQTIVLPRKKRKAVSLVWRTFQMYKTKKNFQKMKRAVIPIQSIWRGFFCRKLFFQILRKRNHSALFIQKIIRRVYIQRKYKEICKVVLQLQAAIRMKLQRKRFISAYHKIIFLQHCIRKFLAYRKFQREMLEKQAKQWQEEAAIRIQKNWRMWHSRVFYLEWQRLRHRAAMKITKCMIGWNVRRGYHSVRFYLIRLQIFLRYWLHRQQKKRRQFSLIKSSSRLPPPLCLPLRESICPGTVASLIHHYNSVAASRRSLSLGKRQRTLSHSSSEEFSLDSHVRTPPKRVRATCTAAPSSTSLPLP